MSNCKYMYRRSVLGKLRIIYSRQKISSKKRGHDQPKYTFDEFRDWSTNDFNFNDLYKKWVLSGYKESMSPSCDRIDDYKGYSFDNIQWMTWEENNRKANEDVKNGKNNKNSKAVVKLNKDMSIVCEYHSGAHANREDGVNARGICLNKPKKVYGDFYYMYKEDFLKNGPPKNIKFIKSSCKEIVQLDYYGRFIKVFNNRNEIKKLDFNYSKITKCCKDIKFSHKKYRWIFKDDYDNEILKNGSINIETKPWWNGIVQLNLDLSYVCKFKRPIDVKKSGFDKSHVVRCCDDISKTHKGFKWMYYDEYKKVGS